MMNTSNTTSNSASQTNMSSQPLLADVLPTFPLPGAAVPAFNYAIALQQHQFQQSLVNQQLLAQQQAVAHAVSIKAAAEQAAARAAEISKLLKGETNDLPMEKSEESAPKREKSDSKSRSQSPSPQSSKSKSRSPVRYRNSHREREQYSPRSHRSYRTDRHSSYYSRYGDHWGYSRSFRRDEDHFGGRSYSYYRGGRNTIRSRRESPPRSHFSRYHHDDSLSPRRRHIRSPSPKLRHKISPRVPRRCSVSRSPINSSSTSSSPRHARTLKRRKKISKSLSSSEDSQSRSTTNALVNDNRVSYDICSSENKSGSDLDVEQREKEARPLRQKLIGSGSSNYSKSESISIDYSSKRNSEEQILKKPVLGRLTSPRGDYSSSHGQSTRRTLRSRDDESNSATIFPAGSTEDVNHQMQMLDHHQSRNDGNIGNRHANHMKSPSADRLSHSSEVYLSIHDHKKDCNESKAHMDADKYVSSEIQKSNKPSYKSLQMNRPGHEQPQKVETDEKRMVKHDSEDCSEFVTMENGVNENIHSTKGGPSNDVLDTCGHATSLNECAIYPLPEANGSTDEKEVGYDAPVVLPNEVARVDAEKIPASPSACLDPEKGSKHRSMSKKKQKHSKRHHKRRHREESEGDDDCRKEKRKERKLKRHENKGHRRHHKSKKRKRRHRDISSSSSLDDL